MLKYRITALCLALLMVFQVFPSLAFERNASDEIVSEEYSMVFHTVRFLADDREIAQMYIRSGEAIGDLPEAPAQAGETFAGWFAQGQEITSETVIRSDLDAEAVYLSSGESGEDAVPYTEAVSDSDLETENAAYVDPETDEIGKVLAALSAEGVKVSVLYGSVPDGTAFRQYTKEETEDMVSRYGLSGRQGRSGGRAVGYTAFDVSLLTSEGEKYNRGRPVRCQCGPGF